jgi:fatty acid desaturase
MRIGEIATREELRHFNARSNWKGARLVLFNYAFIGAIFAVVGAFPNPLTVVLALVLLGGRQLGFAALMHDCGHGLLFASPWANKHIGQWLCAYPILSDQPRYAKGHQVHHARAGTDRDPDLPNYRAYPISVESFRRKVWRDLTGQTGWKALKATWRRGRTELDKAPWNGNALAGHLIVNAAFFAVLAATGHGWLYLLWPAAFVTTYMLFARLRQVAEHGATPDLFDPDPRLNTRTTYVRWWEKLLVAPFHLNYHLEHHLLASVPCYNLKAFHRFLKGKGIYEQTPFPHGYVELFRGALKAV